MSNTELLNKVARLQTWTYAPTTIEDLRAILADFSELELAVAAQGYSRASAAGRIAWIEFARRREYLNFEFNEAFLKNRTSLKVSTPALPVHEQPILVIDKKG